MGEVKQPKDFDGFLGIRWDDNFGDKRSKQFQKAQRFIDSECIRQMKPYMPFRNGLLETSATIGTVIGSGEIRQNLPYAHYQYTGKVYGPNFPIVEENGASSVVFGKYEGGGNIVGWCSPKRKYTTGKNLDYDKSKHPLAGPHWFARMAADKKQIILRGAAKVAGGVVK